MSTEFDDVEEESSKSPEKKLQRDLSVTAKEKISVKVEEDEEEVRLLNQNIDTHFHCEFTSKTSKRLDNKKKKKGKKKFLSLGVS